VPNGIQWVEWQENTRDEVWAERMALLRQECPGIQVHHITGNACVGVMQVGRQAEEEVQRRIKDAGPRGRHPAGGSHGHSDAGVAETAEQCARTGKDWEQGPQGIPGASVGNNRPRSATGDGEMVTPS
jgi:hypothetical protein